MTDELSPLAATYRLFWTNGAGRIDSVAEMIQAESDEDAVRQAQALSESRAVEVWQGARRVAMLNGSHRTS